MHRAIAVAEKNFQSGGVPIGSVIADPVTGAILSEGANEGHLRGQFIAHAEMVAFERAPQDRLSGSVLVSTMEPCVMCLGAAMEAGIAQVVYALAAPENGGFARVTDERLPSFVPSVGLAEAFDQLERWWREVEGSAPESFVGRLLDANRAFR